MMTGRVIMQNMKHIRHIPVMVEQYLRDQLAKARTQTPVNFWGTDPTNYHNGSNVQQRLMVGIVLTVAMTKLSVEPQ